MDWSEDNKLCVLLLLTAEITHHKIFYVSFDITHDKFICILRWEHLVIENTSTCTNPWVTIKKIFDLLVLLRDQNVLVFYYLDEFLFSWEKQMYWHFFKTGHQHFRQQLKEIFIGKTKRNTPYFCESNYYLWWKHCLQILSCLSLLIKYYSSTQK
jgi:hypothetical protein